jgi:hypothetical protein
MALRAPRRRRILLLLATTLVAAAMMAATATSAFAQEKSEESCGASNPKIDAPAKAEDKEKEFKDCGVANNRNYPDKPEGF